VDPHKILLVDDNQELLRLLARLVEAEGWQPLPYPRGKPAVKAIATKQPAAAVVDVLLPDMLGYDVAAALRQAGIPFVFITGIFKGGRASSEARLHHGAADYFEKPFEARRLLEAIRRLLPAEPVPVPAPADAGTDFDVAVAVDSEESVAAMELTGKVRLNEGGAISADLSGQSLQAAGIAAAPVPPSAAGRAVPREAPRPPRSGPADEGELRDNLPELITAFWLAQQTGELALQRGKVKKALYFERGRPCYAISNLIADRFGPFLVRVGKLTSTQLELCQAAADRSQRRTGDILVEMGILRETEKLYYVAQQVKAIAYSLFAWEEGRYRLHFTDRAARESTKVDIRPAHLISRGVKKLYHPERLARLLADDDLLVPTQQPAYPLHDVALENWEAHLLPHVNGTRTFRELVALAGQPADAVRATLWSLVALEILEKRLR
jgi:two-component system, OmpR family, response regulator